MNKKIQYSVIWLSGVIAGIGIAFFPHFLHKPDGKVSVFGTDCPEQGKIMAPQVCPEQGTHGGIGDDPARKELLQSLELRAVLGASDKVSARAVMSRNGVIQIYAVGDEVLRGVLLASVQRDYVELQVANGRERLYIDKSQASANQASPYLPDGKHASELTKTENESIGTGIPLDLSYYEKYMLTEDDVDLLMELGIYDELMDLHESWERESESKIK